MKIISFITGIYAVGAVLASTRLQAQTDNDAIMMNKNQWCNGLTYTHNQWDHYWEGTLKRDNANMRSVMTQSAAFMTNYGITNNLNVMAGLPYVWTHASGGTLHGLKGFQDLSLFVKWKALTFTKGKSSFSIYGIGGFGTPISNYVIDFLPMSIGLGSTNLTGRLMVYFRTGIFFARASGSYVWRSNVKLDRTSYYTTQIHYTNEVQMPDLATFNGSVGIYKKYLIAELMVDNMLTLGGFDIRRNDSPFPSNKMNSTSLGAHVKYTLPFDTHLALVGGMDYVVLGRNVGQATSFALGAFYALYLRHPENKSPHQTSKN